ncbi:retrovirus-related pol polyprotein from transposon TNT 1-94, partial [Tanacetum coccineum]
IGERVNSGPVPTAQASFMVNLSNYDSFVTSENKLSHGNSSGQAKVVKCYNCQGEGHMARQCTQPNRKRDDSWFKDKVLLVQAQANGQILHEEELSFLADPGIAEDADNMANSMINQGVQVMSSSEHSSVINHSETDITSDSNIIPYSHKDNILDSYEQSVEIDCLKQTLSEHLKEKESLMQTVTLLKNNFKKEESRRIDREIALEKKIKQLDNIVFKRDQSARTVHMLTKPQFFYEHTTKQALGFQNAFYLKKAQ